MFHVSKILFFSLDHLKFPFEIRLMENSTKVGLSLLSFAVGLTAFISNSTVIAVFMREARSVKPIHCYLLSDSITNVLTSIVLLVFGVTVSSFKLSSCFCQYFLEAMFVVLLSAGSWSITVIAAERYRALVLLRTPVSVIKRIIILAAIWSAAVIMLVIREIAVQVTSKGNNTSLSTVAENKLITSTTADPMITDITCSVENNFDRNFLTVSVVLFYCLPLLVSIVLYSRIIRKLWKRRELGSSANQEKKKQAVKAMAYILVVFTLCWLPYIFYRMFITWQEPPTQRAGFSPPELGLYVLGCSQSALSALIYVTSSQEFRETLLCTLRRMQSGIGSSVAPCTPEAISAKVDANGINGSRHVNFVETQE